MTRLNKILFVIASSLILAVLGAFAFVPRPAPLECTQCVFDLHKHTAVVQVLNRLDIPIELLAAECRWKNDEVTAVERWGYGRFKVIDLPYFGPKYMPDTQETPHDFLPAKSSSSILLEFERPNVFTKPKQIVISYTFRGSETVLYCRCRPRLR